MTKALTRAEFFDLLHQEEVPLGDAAVREWAKAMYAKVPDLREGETTHALAQGLRAMVRAALRMVRATTPSRTPGRYDGFIEAAGTVTEADIQEEIRRDPALAGILPPESAPPLPKEGDPCPLCGQGTLTAYNGLILCSESVDGRGCVAAGRRAHGQGQEAPEA